MDVDMIEKLVNFIEKWDKHFQGDNSWHAQECCVDDVIAELKEILGYKSMECFNG